MMEINKCGNWNYENWRLNLEIEILKKYLNGYTTN